MKSIWDGWTKQCYDTAKDENGGQCALDYIDFSWQPAVMAVRKRVAGYIEEHYPMPWGAPITQFADGSILTHDNGNILIYANNILKLTPEDFRRIDRETQIAEGMGAIEALVKSADTVEEYA